MIRDENTLSVNIFYRISLPLPDHRDLKGHKETKERKGTLVREVRKVTVALLDFKASQEQL